MNRAAPIVALAGVGLLGFVFMGRSSSSKKRGGGGGGGSLVWDPADSVGEGAYTPLPPSVAREMIGKAVADANGSDTQGKMLSAHSDVETATWQKMREHNFGNITVLPGRGKYWEIVVPERVDGVWKKVHQHFKVYDSFDDGVADFVRYVKARPGAWRAADSGSADTYGQALADAGYFTAYPTDYIAALKTRMA